jgi:asparagine synthase (glutamine-hydrolysing)
VCGLAGALHRDPATRDPAVLSRMMASLSHRGPDDEGSLTIGAATMLHRRLSILDTSPAGHQPMCSDDGRLAILHNGEIYNFLELADELAALGHQFATKTDTEVILAAYREWGADCFGHFNGIWAMALWDAAEGALLLSRDHFGIKPLFIAEVGSDLYFASEIKALLEVPDVDRRPEPAAMRDFLVEGVVDHSERTFFRGVRRVPAAHVMTFTPNGRRSVRYWNPPTLAHDASLAPGPGDEALVDELRQRLVNAVALQLRSDVPLGSCLSGGLDSSTVVSLAAALRDGRLAATREHAERDRLPQLAFFAEFREPGIDERRYVDDVVAATGIELRTVTPTAAEFAESLPTVLHHQDEPFVSASIVVQYHVMKLARESGVTVLLDGQGADELFAGYPPFLEPRLGGAIRQGHLAALIPDGSFRANQLPRILRYAVLGAGRRPGWLGGLATPAWLGELPRTAGTLAEPAAAPPPGTVLAQRLWQQITGDGMPALLRYEDRNSMAFGIEARVPYLDVPLVEFALGLPDRLKIGGGRRKVILQRAARGFVPESVLDRRDKIAFAPPQARWMREAAPAFAFLGDGPHLERDGFVQPGTVASALADLGAGRRAAGPEFRLLVAEMWLRRWA